MSGHAVILCMSSFGALGLQCLQRKKKTPKTIFSQKTKIECLIISFKLSTFDSFQVIHKVYKLVYHDILTLPT